MSRNISKLSGRKGLQDNLFEEVTTLSKKAGKENRIPSKEEMAAVAENYHLGTATLYGSSTFYEFLNPDHLSKKAYVCNGSACLCAGTQAKITEVLNQKFGQENIGHMTCLGRCHENSAFHYAGNNYSGEAIEQIDSICEQQPVLNDQYSSRCVSQTTILIDDSLSDEQQFQQTLTQLLQQSPEQILEEIKTSNLRGRGGAGFPAGLKWESCRQVNSAKKYIVCNADEGDPGAYSDRYLLEQQPLKVIYGMLVAGWIAGADEGALYIRAEYPEAIQQTQQAIDKLISSGLLGNNILDSQFNFHLKIIEGAGAYICGEETALIASIEGRRAEVDVRPPFPTVEGLYKKPTILNNVETFAAIPRLLAIGGQAYSKLGRGKSTGTKLVSLDSGFNKPGIVEIEMGTPLATLINDIAGGFSKNIKAMHIGGPLGGLVPIAKIADLSLDFESFAEQGFLLGHASIVCIPETFPIIDYLQHLFAFTKAESCGKCFPCRLGSTRGTEMLDAAINGDKLLNAELLTDLLDTMQQGSLCALGGGLPLPVKNALQYFNAELSPYFDQAIASSR